MSGTRAKAARRAASDAPRPPAGLAFENAREIVDRGEWAGLRFDEGAGRWMATSSDGASELVGDHAIRRRLWRLLGDATVETASGKVSAFAPSPSSITAIEHALRALRPAKPRKPARPDLVALARDVRAGKVAAIRPNIGELLGADVGLVYSGRLNSLAGPPSAGKSWIALAVALTEARRGRRVIWGDLEDDATTLAARLVALGAEDGEIELFEHVRPDMGDVAAAVEPLLKRGPSLVVIDSLGEAMAAAGLNQNDDADVAVFLQRTRHLADAGPGMLLLDHVTKSTDGRDLWAIGSQRKLAGLNGIALVAVPKKPFSSGRAGTTQLVVAKDRGGVWAVRQRIADVAFEPKPDGGLQVAAWRVTEEAPAADGGWRPTGIMARVSAFVIANPGASTNAIREGVGAKREHVSRALKVLADEGFIATEAGARNSLTHVSIRPFDDVRGGENA